MEYCKYSAVTEKSSPMIANFHLLERVIYYYGERQQQKIPLVIWKVCLNNSWEDNEITF